MNQRRAALEILSERRQETLIISFSGDLDAQTAGQAHAFIDRQLDEGGQQVVVDLSQVGFMSSAGIRVLLDLLRKNRKMGGDLCLAATQPGVQRTLELAGMERVLQVYPTLGEAVLKFGA